MASFNKTLLIGNLTRDIELKHLPSGTAVAESGIAVNDRIKKGEEWVDEAMFVDLTFFGRTAEVAAEYLHKGSPVHIEGRLKFEQWENKDDGSKRSKHKVIVDKMQMLGSRDGSQQSQQSQQSQPARSQQASQPQQMGGGVNGTIADDVPF